MKLNNYLEFLKFKFINNKESLFIYYGILNTIITNILLQISLLFLPIVLSTFISQIFNLNFGYFLYGKKVFRVKYLRKKQYIKYVIVNLFIWNINWILISILNSYNISKNLAALIVIPFLALISFKYQKHFIFVE